MKSGGTDAAKGSDPGVAVATIVEDSSVDDDLSLDVFESCLLEGRAG